MRPDRPAALGTAVPSPARFLEAWRTRHHPHLMDVERPMPTEGRRWRRRAFSILAGVLGFALLEASTRAIILWVLPADRVPCDYGREALCPLRRVVLSDAMGRPARVSHPLLGWQNPRNGAVQGAHTNDFGNRSHPDPTPDRQRPVVVLLGDSFTFGWGVEDDETFAAALARLRPDLEVVNRGVPGYGHDQMLLQLREEGLPDRTQHVILGFVDIDVPRNGASITDAPKPFFSVTDDGLTLQGVPVPSLSEVHENTHRSLWCASVMKAILQSFRDQATLDQQLHRLSEAILVEIEDQVKSNGASFHLMMVPRRPQPGLPVTATTRDTHVYETLCVERAEASCLDLRPAFIQAWSAGEDLELNAHWNARAHAMAGEALASWLPSTAPSREGEVEVP